MSEYIVGNDGDESILDIGEFELRFQKRERIVRCLDCEWFDPFLGDLCMRPDGNGDYMRFEVEPDGFCKWGERK